MSGSYWVINGTVIRDLGYRNNIYYLDVGGVVYRFPNSDEAFDFIDHFDEDSDE